MPVLNCLSLMVIPEKFLASISFGLVLVAKLDVAGPISPASFPLENPA